jgi:hypothetical protein
VKRSTCDGTTKNQTTRIWLILGVFLDDLACIKSLKHLIDPNKPKGFRFHLPAGMFGKATIRDE